MIFALLLMPLVGAAALAVDWSMALQAEGRAQRALDAAGLAAAVAAEGRDPAVEARTYFDANLGNRADAFVVKRFALITDPATGESRLSVSGEIPTYFLRALGRNSIDVEVKSVIALDEPQTEIALVLDVTGSMAAEGRIDAMKLAAKELVDILFAGRPVADNLHIGLVPYVATVNIGAHRTSWLRPDDDVRRSSAYRDLWRGCVMARADDHDQTDAPPSVAAFNSYHWPENHTHVNRWPAVVETFDTARRRENKGPNLGCPNAIASLRSSRAAIDSAIDALYLDTDYSGTLGNIGLVWGWRVVSPLWRGLWGDPTPAAHPLSHDPRTTKKINVLLTDGNNTVTENITLDASGALRTDGSGNFLRIPDMNAYEDYTLLGATNLTTALAEVNNRLAQTCESMKRQGIEIFSITFGTTVDPTTRQLYEDHATSARHYSHSPSNASLRLAFSGIADQINRLRIAR